MRNYILRIYFGPTLFQRFSSSTTVKWGATRRVVWRKKDVDKWLEELA
jgi:hypothetical protein